MVWPGERGIRRMLLLTVGVVEAVVNIVTLAFSLVALRWTYLQRGWMADSTA